MGKRTEEYMKSVGVVDPLPLGQELPYRVFVRTPYNYDMDAASNESGLACRDPSRTKQEFKEEADINTLIKRFGLGYQMPQGLKPPMYGDFTDAFDFQSAMDAVVAAEGSFMAMSADTRARFGNDPHRFVQFINDESNRSEAEKLGFVMPKAVVAPPEPLLVRLADAPKEAPKAP